MNIAINGFGRTGWSVLRRVMTHGEGLEVVVINDVHRDKEVTPEHLAQLFIMTSPPGLHKRLGWDGQCLVVDGRTIPILREQEPGGVAWDALEVDVVVETTAALNDRKSCTRHLDAGARKVIAIHLPDGDGEEAYAARLVELLQHLREKP